MLTWQNYSLFISDIYLFLFIYFLACFLLFLELE